MVSRRELGGATETAPFRVERAGDLGERSVDQFEAGHVVFGLGRRALGDRLHERLGVLVEIFPTIAPDVVERLEHFEEVLLGEVGAAPHRSSV